MGCNYVDRMGRGGEEMTLHPPWPELQIMAWYLGFRNQALEDEHIVYNTEGVLGKSVK